MTASERISRLFGLLCIRLTWMTRVGARRTETHAPRRDKRGRAVVSQPRHLGDVAGQGVQAGP